MSDPIPPAADAAAPASEPVPMTPSACARRLGELFPALFGGSPKPLKLRVHVDIQARAPGEFPKAVLAAFMRRHTGSTAYLQAVARGGARIDLDGQPAGDISAEHRQAAVDELARRRARHAEQRVQDEQARRTRQQLLRDFERTTLTEANFCALKGIDPAALAALLDQARREASEAPPPVRHDTARRHGPHLGGRPGGREETGGPRRGPAPARAAGNVETTPGAPRAPSRGRPQ